MSEAADKIRAWMTAEGVTLESAFVPFSHSRNKDERLSLNWHVTVQKSGSKILETDYSAGEAHCPSYTQGRRTVDQQEAIERECEQGRDMRLGRGRKAIEPDACDVLASLAMDSDVIDYGTFEEWASNFGYDTDSRKAEAIYKACLEIALKLRNGLTDGGLERLRTACEGY